MASDGNSSTTCLLELNPNVPSLQEVEVSKQAVPAGKNGTSMIRKRSFVGLVDRTVSDITAELRRSSINSDLNLHAVTNLDAEKLAQCDCCGIFEECTPSYICRVRELFCGQWVCGLCAEAVEEERHRMGRDVTLEDALRAHSAVCVEFNKVGRSNPALCLADGMRELLKKSSRANAFRSNSNSPRDTAVTKSTIYRSSSCIPVMVRKNKITLV